MINFSFNSIVAFRATKNALCYSNRERENAKIVKRDKVHALTITYDSTEKGEIESVEEKHKEDRWFCGRTNAQPISFNFVGLSR